MPARVSIALGQHVNMYHSYRGDNPQSEDGFGIDIQVITQTLNHLERYPEVPLDWDFDCFETLSERIPHHAPELLTRIRTRIAGGDKVRHMGWAGEAIAWCTDDEFVASITKSRAVIKEVLADDPVDGIYPQECMVTPDFPRMMTRAGLRWVSLFYSATSFTAFRREVQLTPTQQFNPLRWVTPDGSWDVILLPMYHHGDVYDHGSLRGFVDWIHNNAEGEALLYLCFDADSPTWPALIAQQLPEVIDLPYVRFTTAEQYLASTDPVATVTLTKDLADGVFDGFGSWSEKPLAFELFTTVMRARRRDNVGAVYDPESRKIRDVHSELVEKKLRLLATTHFGLASPHLHPDRVASARRAATELEEVSRREVEAARNGSRVKPGLVANVCNATIRTGDGMPLPPLARRRIPRLPKAVGTPDGLATAAVTFELMEDGRPGPVVLSGVQVAGAGWLRSGFLASGVLAEARLEHAVVDGGIRLSGPYLWPDGSPAGGGCEFTLSARGIAPVLRVDVRCEFPQVEGLTEVYPAAISPAVVGLPLYVSRYTFTDKIFTYEIFEPTEALNNHVTNGWVAISDGSVGMVIAFDTTALAGGACMPMRIDEVEDGLAPLISAFGTLWGEQPYHFPEWSGGTGEGQKIVTQVGPQFRPSAPAYAGETLRFRLGILGFHGAVPPEETVEYALGVSFPPEALG